MGIVRQPPGQSIAPAAANPCKGGTHANHIRIQTGGGRGAGRHAGRAIVGMRPTAVVAVIRRTVRDVAGRGAEDRQPGRRRAAGLEPASKQAAEQYRDCLTAAGVPAQIMDGNWVVLQWTGDGSGSVSSGSTDGDRDKAIKECQAKVPDYHDPDFNTK